jgi:2-keto-3-deoxy-L-rhamnonate aldolase RhmA
MHFVLEHHFQKLVSSLRPDDFTDQEAVATVIRATAGNFRLVQRLFSFADSMVIPVIQTAKQVLTA